MGDSKPRHSHGIGSLWVQFQALVSVSLKTCMVPSQMVSVAGGRAAAPTLLQ